MLEQAGVFLLSLSASVQIWVGTRHHCGPDANPGLARYLILNSCPNSIAYYSLRIGFALMARWILCAHAHYSIQAPCMLPVWYATRRIARSDVASPNCHTSFSGYVLP